MKVFIILAVTFSSALAGIAPAAYYTAATPVQKLVRTEAEPFDLHPQYQYSYSVHDSVTADHKTQEESRDGDEVRGSYSIVEPDGTLRTVTYTAGAEGFNAVVDRQPGYAEPAPVVVKKVATAVATPVQYHTYAAAAHPVAKVVSPVHYSAAPVAHYAVPKVAHYAAPAKIAHPAYYSAHHPVHYAAPVAKVAHYSAVPHYYQKAAAVVPVQTQFFPLVAHRPASSTTTPAPEEATEAPAASEAPVAAPTTTTTEAPVAAEESQSDDAIIVESRSANNAADEGNSNSNDNENTNQRAAPAQDGSSSFTYTSSGKQYNFQVAY